MTLAILGTPEAVDAHFATPEGEQDAARMARAIFEDGELLTAFELGDARYPAAVETWLDRWIDRRNAREEK